MGSSPLPLPEALAHAPPRRAARPDPAARWQRVTVDDEAGTITRPPGLMIDTGGTGKGLCADAVPIRLRATPDLSSTAAATSRSAGVGAQLQARTRSSRAPPDRRPIGSIKVARGGIATSGLNVRIWRRADGGYAHHLLDPSTGSPVWSGLVGATALGDTALEAETLSKMALLLGPEGARGVLAEHGGVIVHDDGEVEAIGCVVGLINERPVQELLT